MKLPSLNFLFTNAKKSLFRFPLTILSALIGVSISIYLVELNKEIENSFPYINTLLTAALGIPLFFCTAIYCSMSEVNSIKKALIYSSSFLLLIAIFLSLPNSEVTNNTSIPYIKYTIYNIIIHLLVSFIPYLKTKKRNGFWNYNKTLFIRVWTSILYSGVLYLGLIFALFAVDKLFNIDFHEELYFDIYIITAGLFNTWFFVAGIPEDLNNLENETNYPQGLKIFTQFVLLPLLILYLIILYAYILKIVIVWDWPKGIVAYLISGVSILGILAVLLIYPYSNSKENSWIKKFSRIYYFILFPLIIVLFLAIKMRIEDYGITINRYIIILLGIWLVLVSTYFSVGQKNIKFIPQSLAVIMTLMSFGPWGMFSVSEKSQTNRLMHILEDSYILVDGKVNNEVIWIQDSLPKLHANKLKTNQHLVNDSIHNEIYSIIDYLDDHHGFKSISPLFQQNIDSLIQLVKGDKRYFDETGIYMKSFGLKQNRIYKNNWSTDNNFNFSTRSSDYTDVSGYDFLIKKNYYNKESKTDKFYIQGFAYSIESIDPFEKMLTINTKNEKLYIDLNPLSKSLLKEFGENSNSQVLRKRLTLFKNTKTVALKIEISNMRFKKEKDSLFLTSMKTNIFIKEK
tara:strand:- start:13994 stop:15874 length:1881 start_codon:yes stop_codon:yes gene_type:complete